MTGALRHQSALRALFCALVALVLLTRLLAPSGFMPVVTSKGVMVTLCTGQGAVKVMVARDSAAESRIADKAGNGHPDNGAATNDHCPFAGVPSLPTLPSQPAVANLPSWHLPTGPIAFALKAGWIARLAAPPPPASGPPSAFD
ncbi:DUF2946 family protein [Sphingobium sufflavum]|uniref:DUF2946 family protein n=1 Tax=Sphingobium sufflavum TaxID=1129547 RepID=UPI001F3AB24B|nr:DUF2946 family protein [Sphingobium sufflavum]MCE7797726.1 DUF2946 family protein [Sphingobium sufflavum]